MRRLLALASFVVLIAQGRPAAGDPAPDPGGAAPGGEVRAAAPGGSASAAPVDDADRPEVPAPPFSEGIFPCSDCHAGMELNRTRRVLVDFHADIELKHDEQHRWCLDCHDPAQRDSLHLAGGERIPFEESYRLCGQCHGEKLRDWKAGVHGRRTGSWNGHKQYLLCAHCHNPHQPRFRPLAPKPPPNPPERPDE